METKEYQEIINTADCNAEANFVGADSQLKIMGWVKALIDVSHKAGCDKVVKWVEEHIFAYADDNGQTTVGFEDWQEWQAFRKSLELV